MKTMKNLCMLTTCLCVLFLTGCEKDDEETMVIIEEETVEFKMVGDSRNLEEFMKAEEIKVLQDAYDSVKEGIIGGRSRDKGSFCRLSLEDIPVCPIDGDTLYITVDLDVQTKNWTFGLDVTWNIAGVINYEMGYNAPNVPEYNKTKKVFSANDGTNNYIIMTDSECQFSVKLENTPGYNSALISFPFYMIWDGRVSYVNCCDIYLPVDLVKVIYFNK